VNGRTTVNRNCFPGDVTSLTILRTFQTRRIVIVYVIESISRDTTYTNDVAEIAVSTVGVTTLGTS